MLSNAVDISSKTTRDTFFSSIFFLGSHLWSGGGRFRWNETAGCHFAALQFYCYSSSNLQIACVLVSRRLLIILATAGDIGRVLLGSSKSPDIKMGVISEIFQAPGNVHAAKELLNMLVRIGSVAGRLYLRILALTLSILGALLEGRDLIIFSTSASVTNWKLKAAWPLSSCTKQNNTVFVLKTV